MSVEGIDAKLLEAATPAEKKRYKLLLERKIAALSPLDYACWLNPETIRYPHIEYINDHIVALVEYRLYHSGPGPEAKWFYVVGEETFPVKDDNYENIPDYVDEFYGEHPTTGERVVFRLAMAVGPRHGKSYLTTEYTPSWYLFRHPEREIAFATYSDEFAQEWGVKMKNQLVDHEKSTGLKLRGGRTSAAARLNLESGGSMRFVGTGGSLTGTGYQLGIIDDPFKDQAEADSQAIRNQKAKWYSSTFSTRKTRVPGKGLPVEIMMFTRWHEDDIAGRFAYDDEGQPSEDWCVLRLPSIAEDDDPLGREPGEALCPSIKTRAELNAIQKQDPSGFASLYQGDPSQDETGMFGSFNHYTTKVIDEVSYYHLPKRSEDEDDVLIKESDCIVFATVDLAATKNTWSDYSVYALWAFHRFDQKLILINRFRDRVESADHETWLRACYVSHDNTLFVGIENKTFGQTLVQTMVRKGGMTVRPLAADTDKVARAIPYGQAVKNGQVWIPKHASWLYTWTQEHANFPRATTHDDQVDTGGYAWLVALTLPSIKRAMDDDPQTTEGKIERYVDKRQRARFRSQNRGGLSGRLGR